MEHRQNGHHKPEVVVITGASAGVGRATARAFAERGAWIGLLARGREGLEAARREVEELGGRALAIPTDVADAEAVERAAEQVEEAFGAIDIWVNNAMVTVYSPFLDIEPDEYKRVTDVCYHGQVFGTRSALKRMKPRNRGTIVSVGSALAYRGIPLQSAYCGAKHAIVGMYDSLRSELIHEDSDVQIVEVHMPALNTPQFQWGRNKLGKKAQPVPPIFQPEMAADAVVYAATDGRTRREIYVAYPTVEAVMGGKFAAGVADWYLARSPYEDQTRDEPLGENPPDNLFDPVEGDFGAHGPFDAEAKDHSLQYWATKRKRWLAAGLGFGAAAVAGALMTRLR
jgi:NAD(P)-dependent dehydrogenase (short-subunit alcohol dehydrogenase family)